MSRTYWRISPAFWGDEKVVAWSQDTRLLALYLLTCEHRTIEGLFRLPKGYILADLGWGAERLGEPFGELLREGFIEYDERVGVCLITNALAYQAPENPNQVKAALNILDELPETCLFAGLFRQAERFSERLAQGLRERFPERLGEGFGQPPAPALALAPRAAAHACAREEAEPVDNSGSSGSDISETSSDDPLLWELWELPGWKRDPPADGRMLAEIRRDYPRADIGRAIADVRARARDGTLKAGAGTALRSFAKRLHEEAGRAPTPPSEIEPLPPPSAKDQQAQAERAQQAKREVERLRREARTPA